MVDRKKLLVQVPLFLFDDLLTIHVEAPKGQMEQDTCRHCMAMAVVRDIAQNAEAAADTADKAAKAGGN